MAEGILMGAALGGGSAMLTGNDPLKGAALGGAMGGVGGAMSSAPAAGVSANTAGQLAAPQMLAQTGAQQATANASMGGLGSTIGSGFTDLTGMTGQDVAQMGMREGMNAMQPEPQQQIQAAPMGQGISRPQVDLSQSGGSLLSSNPLTSGAGGQQLTPEQLKQLQQQGLL